METTHLSCLLFFLLLLLLLLLWRRRAPAKPTTNHCPYPNAILGNLIPFVRNWHRFLDWYTELLRPAPAATIEVWGPLGLGHAVTTANPAIVDHFLRANFDNYVKGPRFRVALSDLIGDGLFAADGRLWSLQRKIASYSFSSRSLRRFAGHVLQTHLHHRLLPFLAAAADSGEAIDLQDVLRRFTFDNICNVAFGVDSSTLLETQDRRHEALFAAFDDAVKISFKRIFKPTTWIWKMRKLLDVGSERRLRQAIHVIDDYAMAIIESKESHNNNGSGERDQDLLSRFMAAIEEDGGNELGTMFTSPETKRRFLRDVVVSVVLAGKDTTSSALTWFFWLLAANPRCEQRVYDEVSQQKDDGSDGDGGGDVKGMHYLHAAITEGMRLYPPVPINSRVAVADDMLPDGAVVGAGWFASYSAYVMGRMQELWGEDCGEFRPERWLSGDDGGEFVAAEVERYPVFHAGPRACIGKEMAYVQMKAVAAAVLRRFTVEVVAASMEAPPPYEMTATLKMKGGLWVRLRRRAEHA